MVEGARLESVCRGNSTEGSNPSLSAIHRLIFRFPNVFWPFPGRNRGGEKVSDIASDIASETRMESRLSSIAFSRNVTRKCHVSCSFSRHDAMMGKSGSPSSSRHTLDAFVAYTFSQSALRGSVVFSCAQHCRCAQWEA